MLLCWAEFWNCPKPSTLVCVVYLSWYLFRKIWGSSGVGEVFVLLSSVAKNYENSLFYSTKFISKEVTPMILIQMCTLYRPRQASMSPYNLFGKSLFSHFHTEPLFRPGIISKIFQRWLGLEPNKWTFDKASLITTLSISLISYYNIRIKCNISQAFFTHYL